MAEKRNDEQYSLLLNFVYPPHGLLLAVLFVVVATSCESKEGSLLRFRCKFFLGGAINDKITRKHKQANKQDNVKKNYQGCCIQDHR